MLEGKRVLVTGGSGFMGTHLMKSLITAGVDVVNFDRKPPSIEGHARYWREVDLCNAMQLSEEYVRYSPHLVVHLAARTDLDESADISDYDDNIGAVENLLREVESCEDTERVLVTSSMLVCALGYKPTSDTDYNVSTVYGRSKVMTEEITRNSGLSKTWCIIRPATIWGAWHYGLKAGFFGILSRGLYVHPGRKPLLKSYGYVENSVHQILGLLQAPANSILGRTFYISDAQLDLLSWVNGFSRGLRGKEVIVVPVLLLRVIALAGDVFVKLGVKSFPMTSFRLNNMTTENIVNTDGIFDVTGQPPYSMEEGIERTLAWLKQEGL
jgi:nucleoside-diphosphate-sugar epimerase